MDSRVSAVLIRTSNGYKISLAGIAILAFAILFTAVLIVVAVTTGAFELLIIPVALVFVGVIFAWVGVIMTSWTARQSEIRMVDEGYVRAIARYTLHDLWSLVRFRRLGDRLTPTRDRVTD